MATSLQRQEAKLKAKAAALSRKKDALKLKEAREAQAQKRLATAHRDAEVKRLGTLAYRAGLGGIDDVSLVEGLTLLATLIWTGRLGGWVKMHAHDPEVDAEIQTLIADGATLVLERSEA